MSPGGKEGGKKRETEKKRIRIIQCVRTRHLIFRNNNIHSTENSQTLLKSGLKAFRHFLNSVVSLLMLPFNFP